MRKIYVPFSEIGIEEIEFGPRFLEVVVGFCFSYVAEGSIRDEAGETLPPLRHNPSANVNTLRESDAKTERGKRGLKRTPTHQSFNLTSIPGTIESEPCSADGVQAKFEILLVCAAKRRLLRQGFTFLHRIKTSRSKSRA
jgi:hypothetical protein